MVFKKMDELKRTIRFFLCLLGDIAPAALLYGIIISQHFWLLPCHRDSVEYLAPAIFGTSWGGYYPWLDRINLAVGLRIWYLAFSLSPEDVGQWFMLSVNLATMLVSIVWAARRAGFLAGLMIGISLMLVPFSFIWFYCISDQLLTLFIYCLY
jgi:hypothetical protein